MLTLVALLLGVVRPPAAYVEPGHVRLAVSSWCWSGRCGAPIAASGKAATIVRGTTVRVEFTFVPTSAHVAVSGAPIRLTRHGSEISWQARRAGGMTINVTAPKGFVAYVGRLVLKAA